MSRRKLLSTTAALALGLSLVAGQVASAQALAMFQSGGSGKVTVLSGGSAYYYNYTAYVTKCRGDQGTASNPTAVVTQARAYIGSITATGPRVSLMDFLPGSTVSLRYDSTSNLSHGWACMGWPNGG